MIECGNIPVKKDKLDALADKIPVEPFLRSDSSADRSGDCDGCERCAGYCANCNRRRRE